MVPSHRFARFLLVFLVLFSLALTGGAAQAGSPVQAASASTASLGSLLDANGILNLPAGFSGSITAEGWQLVSGENEPPRFVPLSSAESSNPLGSTGAAASRVAGDEKWLPGFNVRGATPGQVKAVVAGAGSDVYIGGEFITVGDVRANPLAVPFVAKWDGSHWSALGYGFNGVINALAWDGANNILYAGGSFLFVCGASDSCSSTRVNHIAKWSEGAWSALSYGVNDVVFALALDGNNDLYAGGYFLGYCTNNATPCANTTVNHIAKWNRSGGSWSPLTHLGFTGVDDTVRALAWRTAANDLILGGDFTHWSGGAVMNHLALWNGTADGLLCNGVDGSVRALAWDSAHQALFVGGDFVNLLAPGCGLVANVQVNHIAKYTSPPAHWASLDHGVDGDVSSIVVDSANQKAYVGGHFYRLCTNGDCTSTSDANYMTQWDYSGAGAWSTLGAGTAGWVEALALNGGLFAGGSFSRAGDAVAFGIAKWNSPNWSALGGGNGVSLPFIFTVAADGKGNVYVGGFFQSAGGVRANNIAKWDGNAWSALDKGLMPSVQAIAVAKDGSVYAGGTFTYTCGNIDCTFNGTRVNSIAKWDGAGWSPVGSGLSSPPMPPSQVIALAFDSQGNLFAGGTIPMICGNIDCTAPPPLAQIAHNLVKWTPPSGPWAPVGGGTSDQVLALAVDSANKLYVGGSFASVCGNADCSALPVQVNRIAKWTGTAWERLAFGVDGIVNALAVDRTDRLYVGGAMTKACGDLPCGPSVLVQLNRIGRWTPSGASGAWDKLGYGFTSAVSSLAADDANNLFAGGVVGLCGNDTCVGPPTMVSSVAKWNGSAWSPLGSGIWPMALPVRGIAWQFGRLSVGGTFYGAGDKVSSNFAQYQDNTPPTLAHILKTGYPGGILSFTTAEFSGAMTDAESEALAKIRVLSLPANGTLKLSGAAVTANQEIAVAQVPNLTFTPNASWTGTTSFSWNGHDGNSYAVAPANVNITIAFRLLYLPFVRR